MTTAVWFRNDLRIVDNAALARACEQSGAIIGIYLFTPDQFTRHQMGPTRLRFIIENVIALSNDLKRVGISLIAAKCSDFKNSVDVLKSVCQEHKIQQVIANREVEYNEKKRDQQAQRALQEHDINLTLLHDQTLLPPGSVLTEKETPFQVFTAFKRSWLKQASSKSVTTFQTPDKKRHSKQSPAPTPISQIQAWAPPTDANQHWKAGSDAAYSRLNGFLEQAIDHYDTQRDLPDLDSTSQLSPYLSVGAISARACFFNALQVNHFHWDSGSEGITTWINELIWREFYKHLTFLTPDLCKGDVMQTKTRNLKWVENDGFLQQWQNGETGFPFVDAGMRQLNTMGWMHNRLRMVTAMFLSKHLFLNWKLGERYFCDKLIDLDFSLNNGGWQWSASTGADAAPYFRIFNPTRQSERFDPDGNFIRKWVPELASLNAKDIHNPSTEQREKQGYPMPMVDHKQATQRTKAAFQQLNEQPA